MNGLPITSIVLYTLASGMLVLATTMFVQYQRSESIRYYFGFLLGLSVIAFAQASLPILDKESSLLLVTRIGYFGGIVTFTMLLMFSLYFPVPTATRVRIPALLWVVPIAFFTPLILLSNSFVSSVTLVSPWTKEVYGPAFFLFPGLVIVYVIWSIHNLFLKRELTQGTSRPTGLLLWTLLGSMSLGLVFDVLLPAIGQTRIPVGIFSAIVLFGLSTFIVLKK